MGLDEVIETVRLFSPKPGDVVVCSVPVRLRYEQADMLRKKLGESFPDVPILIIHDGMTLDMLTKDEVLNACSSHP